MPARATCSLCGTSEVVYTAFALHEWQERHEGCDEDSVEVVTYEPGEDFAQQAHEQSKAVAESEGLDVMVLDEDGEEFCSFHLGGRDAHLARYFADQAGVSVSDWLEIAIKKATIGA